ncbi:hypothetical protein [Paraconexibacter sp. AEG42_29]
MGLTGGSPLRRFVVLASATLACAGVGAPGAQARKQSAAAPPTFGISGGLLWHDDDLRGPIDEAPHAEAIGRTPLQSVRVIADWNHAEPEAPDRATGAHRFRWTLTDATAGGLARNGLRWDVILGFSSAWAGTVPGTAAGPAPLKPFAAFATAFAERYGRGGRFWRDHPELPYVPVTTYQVWNEANLDMSWTAPTYAEFYAGVRAAIIAAEPQARVAVGGLAQGKDTASRFLRAMVAARPSLVKEMDAVGVTIYRRIPQQVLEDVVAFRRTLDELGARDTAIDVNETGWTTSGGVLLTDITPVTDEIRGGYLGEVVELLAASDCGLGTVQPYAWVTQQQLAFEGSEWFGLADPVTAVMRPSAAAYVAAVARVLSNPPPATRPGPCGRPDLPRLIHAPTRVEGPLRITLARRCSARRVRVRFTLGAEPEPYRRFVIALPGGLRREVRDPDAAGRRTATTTITMALPKRPGRARLVAYDELGRQRAVATTSFVPCKVKRR